MATCPRHEFPSFTIIITYKSTRNSTLLRKRRDKNRLLFFLNVLLLLFNYFYVLIIFTLAYTVDDNLKITIIFCGIFHRKVFQLFKKNVTETLSSGALFIGNFFPVSNFVPSYITNNILGNFHKLSSCPIVCSR